MGRGVRMWGRRAVGSRPGGREGCLPSGPGSAVSGRCRLISHLCLTWIDGLTVRGSAFAPGSAHAEHGGRDGPCSGREVRSDVSDGKHASGVWDGASEAGGSLMGAR